MNKEYIEKIIKENEREILESSKISIDKIFWDCRNTAMNYRKPITAIVLRRIKNKTI